jgi:hypothetical protein
MIRWGDGVGKHIILKNNHWQGMIFKEMIFKISTMDCIEKGLEQEFSL